MQEKIKKSNTLSNFLDINSGSKLNDFAFSDKRIIENKSGYPIILIQDNQPSRPEPKTFNQIRLNLHIETKQKELKTKIIKSSQGLSPLSKRKIEKRYESLISPHFKQPRDPATKGLSEIMDFEIPEFMNKQKFYEEKIKETQMEIKKSYTRHLSKISDFQKVSNSSFFFFKFFNYFIFYSITI